MRGEYCRTWGGIVCVLELPPRARRIQLRASFEEKAQGTTSACAENTSHPFTNGSNIWNYLRVRGEYPSVRMWVSMRMELPPRARRIHGGRAGRSDGFGTTSACAENTSRRVCLGVQAGNYLRVRGEYSKHIRVSYHAWELPPRARRIP